MTDQPTDTPIAPDTQLIQRMTSYATYEIGQGTMPQKMIKEMERQGLDRKTAQALVDQITSTHAHSQRKTQHQEGIQKMLTGAAIIVIVLVIGVAIARFFQENETRIGGLSVIFGPILIFGVVRFAQGMSDYFS